MRCCGIMASDYSAGRYALVECWIWGRWNMLVLFYLYEVRFLDVVGKP